MLREQAVQRRIADFHNQNPLLKRNSFRHRRQLLADDERPGGQNQIGTLAVKGADLAEHLREEVFHLFVSEASAILASIVHCLNILIADQNSKGKTVKTKAC